MMIIWQILSKKTGLIPDAYFSATKIAWILDNVDGAREKQKMENLHLEQLIHGLSGILLRKSSCDRLYQCCKNNAV